MKYNVNAQVHKINWATIFKKSVVIGTHLICVANMLAKLARKQALSIQHSGCPLYLNLINLSLLYNLQVHDHVLFSRAPVLFSVGCRVESSFLIRNKFLYIRDHFHWLQQVDTMQFSSGSDSVKLHLRKIALIPLMPWQ